MDSIFRFPMPWVPCPPRSLREATARQKHGNPFLRLERKLGKVSSRRGRHHTRKVSPICHISITAVFAHEPRVTKRMMGRVEEWYNNIRRITGFLPRKREYRCELFFQLPVIRWYSLNILVKREIASEKKMRDEVWWLFCPGQGMRVGDSVLFSSIISHRIWVRQECTTVWTKCYQSKLPSHHSLFSRVIILFASVSCLHAVYSERNEEQ